MIIVALNVYVVECVHVTINWFNMKKSQNTCQNRKKIKSITLTIFLRLFVFGVFIVKMSYLLMISGQITGLVVKMFTLCCEVQSNRAFFSPRFDDERKLGTKKEMTGVK